MTAAAASRRGRACLLASAFLLAAAAGAVLGPAAAEDASPAAIVRLVAPAGGTVFAPGAMADLLWLSPHGLPGVFVLEVGRVGEGVVHATTAYSCAPKDLDEHYCWGRVPLGQAEGFYNLRVRSTLTPATAQQSQLLCGVAAPAAACDGVSVRVAPPPPREPPAPGAPGAPRFLHAEPGSAPGQIRLAWGAPAPPAGATALRIYRGVQPVDLPLLDVVPADSQTYVDHVFNPLDPRALVTGHYYRVSAVGPAGEGASSQIVCSYAAPWPHNPPEGVPTPCG